MAKDIYKKDLYGIIGVADDATEKDILKGYRKKALKCHPDKNPDNPKAAELFHELSQALEVLTDAAARAAYDQTLKAKKVAAERTRVLDSKRKKFKEDLEAREQAAFEQNQKAAAAAAERKLQAEISRLRKEGSRLLEQEQARLKEELKRSQAATNEAEDEQPTVSDTPRIKLKWKALKNDPSNGGYNSENLRNILGCYGHINTLLVSAKRNGSAILEFESSGASADILEEHGLKDNPFSITWLSGKPNEKKDMFCGDDDTPVATNGSGTGSFSSNVTSTVNFDAPQMGAAYGASQTNGQNISNVSSGESDRDFENLVLRKMRQAEERKKLIEQMMKEEEDNG